MRAKNVLLVLKFVILVSLVLTACQNSSNAKQSGATLSPVVGTWTVTVTPEAGLSFVNALLFSSDGTVINMENTGIIGLGVWEKLSEDTYALTFQEFAKHVKIISTIKVSADDEQFRGSYIAVVTDSQGNLLDTEKGTAAGVRQHVEPMP